jgi:hypothetical protein
MWKQRIPLLVCSALIASLPALAQKAATGASRPVMELTALDYYEIEQLSRKYAWAIDTCGNDGFDYADLYTPDGVFISGEDGQHWEGREKLAEAAGGNGRGCPFVQMPLTHVIVNLVIEATPDGATGKSYLIYPGKHGEFVDDKHNGHDGGYQDMYVKTAQGWRFKQRIHVHPPQIPGEYAGIPNTELEAQRNAR